MKELEIDILGQSWYITSLPNEEYITIHAEDKEAEAFTDTSLSTITINSDYLTLVVITHELVHAYIEMCCVGHSDIDKASFEEIMCDIFGKYGRDIVKQADFVYNKFKGK